MGQQQMKARAVEVLEALLKEKSTALTEEEQCELVAAFRKRL